jgi:hypothetical protein
MTAGGGLAGSTDGGETTTLGAAAFPPKWSTGAALAIRPLAANASLRTRVFAAPK